MQTVALKKVSQVALDRTYLPFFADDVVELHLPSDPFFETNRCMC